MPRFVILEHDHPEMHWDFMLESAGVLRTWRLEEPPSTRAADIPALALADHRLAYLDYEGPVSGRRGNVRRWDAGVYREMEPTTAQLVAVSLQGARMCGTARLRCLDTMNWVCSWAALD